VEKLLTENLARGGSITGWETWKGSYIGSTDHEPKKGGNYCACSAKSMSPQLTPFNWA